MTPTPATRRRSRPDAGGLRTRAAESVPELRGGRRLVFYPAVFDVETTITEDGKRYREVIRRGAFAGTLADGGNDVFACVEHNLEGEQTFARRSGGLILQEDARGLFASAYLADDPTGNAVLAEVRAGKFRGCSFAFRTLQEIRHPAPYGGLDLVELLAVDLVEVTLTRAPFYPGTVVSIRGGSEDVARRRIRLLKLRPGARG